LVYFGLLGPVLVRGDGDERPVTAGRHRVVLAALLARPGRLVPAADLAELVWDGAPPAGALDTLRSYVMRLRRALGPQAATRIVTRPPGYLAEAGAEELDTLTFTTHCRAGAAALHARQYATASWLLRRALELWRGEPFADVPSQRLRDAEVPALTEQRLQALHSRIDADLQLGRHRELVPELISLTGEHPLREPFYAQLMVALAGSGRHADALAAYDMARRRLMAELGIEPVLELRDLQRRVLGGEDFRRVTSLPAFDGLVLA
jgi:DNA-binding SARP family transcriptional activator